MFDFFRNIGPSYHHNRRPIQHDRERLERERIERERERIHARERELAAQYDLNDDDILGNRGHLNASMPPTTHIRGHPSNDDREYMRERERERERVLDDRDHDRDRYPMAAHSSHLPSSGSRDYSPHRGGGGSSRRVHAM